MVFRGFRVGNRPSFDFRRDDDGRSTKPVTERADVVRRSGSIQTMSPGTCSRNFVSRRTLMKMTRLDWYGGECRHRFSNKESRQPGRPERSSSSVSFPVPRCLTFRRDSRTTSCVGERVANGPPKIMLHSSKKLDGTTSIEGIPRIS